MMRGRTPKRLHVLHRLGRLVGRWFKRGTTDQSTSSAPRSVRSHAPQSIPKEQRAAGPSRDAAPAPAVTSDIPGASEPSDDWRTASEDFPLSPAPPTAPRTAPDGVLAHAEPNVSPWMPEAFGLAEHTVNPKESPPVRPLPPTPALDTAPVFLTDYSAVAYAEVSGGYAPPPGDARIGTVPPPRWLRGASRLLPLLVTETVRDLAQRGSDVDREFNREPVAVLWPASAPEGGPGGFQVAELDASYLVGNGPGKGQPRALEMALPSMATPEERPADDFDRLELIRLVSILLDGLHRHDVVSAGLDWPSFAFTLDPRPRIVLQHPEGLRRLGGEFLGGPSHLDPPLGGSPFDADRHAFAVLAFRLLVSHEADGALDPWNRRGIRGLSGSQVNRLWALWERAGGPAGTRPQVAEWREALGA